MNTSVGVGDRRLPTASFDSARKMILVAMFSVCCIIICCHCCGVREELYLVCLTHHEAVFCDEKWVPISAERLCKFLRAKIGGVGVARLSHLNRRPTFKKTLDKSRPMLVP